MDHSPDIRTALDVDRLRHAVSVAAWRRIDVIGETGSTNADLLARAAGGEDIEGAVLVAEYQTAGRGRHGRRWSAPARSQLAFSAAVGVGDIPADAWGWLPLATGVAVVDAVAETAGVTAGLKWPNDVLAEGRKLAGILAEVAAPAPTVVVGVGLNVTMTPAEVPEPDAPLPATSLLMLGASVTDRNLLLEKVLGHLAARFEAWRNAGGADEQLAADYRSRSLTLGTRVRASLPGDRVVEGRADAIDDMGRLVIDTDGQTTTVSAGDITHLRPTI